MDRKPIIICAGMLDTKGSEIRYLAKQVEKRGGIPLIMDISLGHETGEADIPLRELLSATGNSPEDIFLLSRSAAAEIVAAAAAAKAVQLFREGRLDGVIGWAGGLGTTVTTAMMRALPMGLPKVMLSAGALGNAGRWLGASDIYISNPISEKGLNQVTRMTVENGVCAVVAMAKERIGERGDEGAERPLAAATLCGGTEAAAVRCGERMEELGWDVLYFPANGSGAAMEDLIREGKIKAVFDLTPAEITNGYFESGFGMPKTWNGIRFTAAFDMGIPVVAAPGSMAEAVFGSRRELSDELKKDFKEGRRPVCPDTGAPYFEEGTGLIVPTTLQENRKLSNLLSARLGRAVGPALFLIPMKGWSAYDKNGFYGAGREEPVWIPDRKNPAWSRRAADLREILERQMDRTRRNLDVIACDLHLLDREFSDLASEAMERMLEGTWKPGMFRELEYVVKRD